MRSPAVRRGCILAAMKTRMLLVVAAALVPAAVSWAQSVDLIVMGRQQNFLQTTAGTASLAGATPYEFVIFLQGQNLTSGGFSFSFKKPGDAVTVYASEPDEVGSDNTAWEAPLMALRPFASITSLAATFPHGYYTISLGAFADVTLDMPKLDGVAPNDGFANTPFIIGTQNGNPVTWSGGRMLVDPTKELTLTSTTFTTNNPSMNNRIGLWLDGPGLNVNLSNDTDPPTFTFSGASIQHQILANTMTPGIYYGGLEFNVFATSLVDLGAFDAGLSGGSGISVYSALVDFQIQAIPEPSTYAAILGVLALAGVAIHRRGKLRQG